MPLPDVCSTNAPLWLRCFVDEVLQGIHCKVSSAPVGCHFKFERDMDLWEVTLFAGRSQVLGGPHDGMTVPTGLELDISRMLLSFEGTPGLSWQSEKYSDDDELGNHVLINGFCQGNHLHLRVLHDAPEWAGLSQRIHASTGRIEDLW
ncbi:MAG: hypothetical protein WCK86_05075 [Planctomycetia bacterium]